MIQRGKSLGYKCGGKKEVLGVILPKEKTDSFVALDYNIQKDLLKIIGFDFYFILAPLNEDPITTGEYPTNASYVVNAERIVTYNNNPAKLELRLWK